MSTAMPIRFSGQPPKREHLRFLIQNPNLTKFLSFISSSTPRELRILRIAMDLRRDHVLYEVTMKTGVVEHWTVDDPDQMISILLKDRREISKISNGKESLL